MIVWRIVAPCPLLGSFAQRFSVPASALAYHQVLKPLASAGQAIAEGRVLEKVALLLPDDTRMPGAKRQLPLAFSLDEACAPFIPPHDQTMDKGEFVARTCAACPANVTTFSGSSRFPGSVRHQEEQSSAQRPADRPAVTWAGCCDVLLNGNLADFTAQTQSLQESIKPLPLPIWTAHPPQKSKQWLATAEPVVGFAAVARQVGLGSEPKSPEAAVSEAAVFQAAARSNQDAVRVWYRWFSEAEWDLDRIESFVAACDQHSGANRSQVPGEPRRSGSSVVKAGRPEPTQISGWFDFLRALHRCREHRWGLQVEMVPRGFSDGHDWWIGPHCHRCHAAMALSDRSCTVCDHVSGPVPVRKRRVMGWAPYWPLESLLGSEQAERLLRQASG